MIQDLEISNGPQSQPLCHDVRGAAARLSISPVTVRKLVRQQRLTRLPNIRKLLIPENSLRQFAATAK
jgi:Helix-turn-helix domain